MKHLQMQRRPGSWPERYQAAQQNRIARGLAVIPLTRLGRELISSANQRRAA